MMPEPCSRKRGARPSRSLCSASRRTDGAADSTHRMVRQGGCCRHVGGTPTAEVWTFLRQNLKGISTESPGLERSEYPGWIFVMAQPQRGCVRTERMPHI